MAMLIGRLKINAEPNAATAGAELQEFCDNKLAGK